MVKGVCELCKFRLIQALVAGIVGVLSASAAHASVISGPALTTNDGGYLYSGVGFTATVSTALTSFTFKNQGAADTVILVDPLGNILDSVGTPASTPSDTVSVNWALTAGHQYYLLQSTASNSLYGAWGLAPPSDAEIAMTDTGVFSRPPGLAPILITAEVAGPGMCTGRPSITSLPVPVPFPNLLL